MSYHVLQELLEWNAQYRQKFGFVFIICASGRSTSEILAELKVRFRLLLECVRVCACVRVCVFLLC